MHTRLTYDLMKAYISYAFTGNQMAIFHCTNIEIINTYVCTYIIYEHALCVSPFVCGIHL